MAEPVRALQTVPSITLDPVFFEDGNLWQARYPSLIDYDQAPELQFEPAFHVCSEDPSQEVDFIFHIEGAVFEAPGGVVSWQSLVVINPTPNVEVELLDGDPQKCKVHWTRSTRPEDRLTALRIVCRPILGEPSRENDDWEALTQVEGGVYLAIIDRGEARHNPSPVRNPDKRKAPGMVRVVGIDANSRPVYDLFHEELGAGLPPELSMEPAFRAGHGERLDFDLALALPPGPFADIRFKTENGQVAMSYAVPSLRPESLIGSPADVEGRVCTVQWHHAALTSCVTGHAEAGTVLCRQGRTATFYAQVEPGPFAWFSTDPTVIDPPACDASGVCTKPRDRGEDS